MVRTKNKNINRGKGENYDSLLAEEMNRKVYKYIYKLFFYKYIFISSFLFLFIYNILYIYNNI